MNGEQGALVVSGPGRTAVAGEPGHPVTGSRADPG